MDSRFVIGVTEDNGRWDRIRLEERAESSKLSELFCSKNPNRIRWADCCGRCSQSKVLIGFVNALQEFEDLHRMQREGLGRIQEWHDASAVVLVAKWRALSQIVAWLIFCKGQALRWRPQPAASWISTNFKRKLCFVICWIYSQFGLDWIHQKLQGFFTRLLRSLICACWWCRICKKEICQTLFAFVVHLCGSVLSWD